jgi:hypothetical protein
MTEAMARHVVEQGECFRSIAGRYGWSSWRRLYEHEANADLRRRRSDPSVLLPGDEVVIPDEPPEPPHRVELDVETPLDLSPETCALRLTLRDHDGAALADREYVLQVDGRAREGTTTSEGLLETEVPVAAQRAHVTVFLDGGRTWTAKLRIGHLDPADTVSGAQARLRALGFSPGRIDGDHGDHTREALTAFQEKHGLEASGELDETTVATLREVHGC